MRYLFYLAIILLATYPIDWLKPRVGEEPLPLSIPVFYIMVLAVAGKTFANNKALSIPFELRYIAWMIVAIIASSLFVSIFLEVVDFLVVLKLITYLLIPIIFWSVVGDAKVFVAGFILFLLVNIILVSYGYYGFFTGTPGEPGEHFLKYWGVHYTKSTRNSDVIFPLVLSITSLAYLCFGPNRVMKLIFGPLFLFSTIAVIVSQSRGGWAAFVTGIGCLLCIRHIYYKKIRWIALLASAGVSLISVIYVLNSMNVSEVILGRLKSVVSSDDPSISNVDRLLILKSSIVKTVYHPLGVGTGNFSKYVPADEIGISYDLTSSAENTFVTVALESGWFATVALLGILIRPVRIYFLRCRRNATSLSWHIHAMMGAICSLGVYLLFNYQLVSLYTWILLSLSYLSIKRYESARHYIQN